MMLFENSRVPLKQKSILHKQQLVKHFKPTNAGERLDFSLLSREEKHIMHLQGRHGKFADSSNVVLDVKNVM